MTAAQRLRLPDMMERLTAMADVVAAGSADAETRAALAACLGDAGKNIQRRAAETFAALAARDATIPEVLLQALESDLPRRRWGAAYALSLLGAPPPVLLPVLLEALGLDDGDVRWAAGAILVRMRDVPSVTDALRMLVTSGNTLQRKMAVYCLRDLEARSPEVEQVIVTALDDADPNVRLAAVSCLPPLAMDRPAAAQRLVGLLGDPDVSVQRIAAAALGRLGEPSGAVLGALRDATATADVSLRRAAARSLRMLSE